MRAPVAPSAGGRAGEIGLVLPSGGEGEEGVDRGFEGAGVPLDLGEQEASLDCGEEGEGEVVRVGVGWEVPGGVQFPQPAAYGG